MDLSLKRENFMVVLGDIIKKQLKHQLGQNYFDYQTNNLFNMIMEPEDDN